MKCEICGKEFESIRFLRYHIKIHNINYQDYLKKFIWKSFKYYNVIINPGICPVCGNSIKLKHHKLQKFCCKKCADIFLNSNDFWFLRTAKII